MVFQQFFNFRTQCVRVSQIAKADGTTANFIFVCWADAATRCADFGFAQGFFAHLVKQLVNWQDQARIFSNGEGVGIDFNTLCADRCNFFKQGSRVDNNAIADDGQLAAANDAGRQKAEFVFYTVDNKRMTGVMTALEAYDHIGTFR